MTVKTLSHSKLQTLTRTNTYTHTHTHTHTPIYPTTSTSTSLYVYIPCRPSEEWHIYIYTWCVCNVRMYICIYLSIYTISLYHLLFLSSLAALGAVVVAAAELRHLRSDKYTYIRNVHVMCVCRYTSIYLSILYSYIIFCFYPVLPSSARSSSPRQSSST